MALPSLPRRTFRIALASAALVALATACGVESSDDDPLGDDLSSSGGRRQPGGGPSSGAVFGSSSSSSGRPSSSSSSSSSGGGSSSSSSSSSSSGAVACDDPNDAPDFGAADFSAVTANGSTFDVSGVLDGELDADWYGYDITGSPTTALALEEAIDAELCIFMECKAGTLTLQCRDGSVGAVDDDGNPGCCAIGSAAAPPHLSTYMYCAPSVPDDSYATIRVTSRAAQCSAYTANVTF